MANASKSGPDRPSTIPWPPLLLLATVALSVALGRNVPLPWPGVGDTLAHGIGLALGAAGIILALWSIFTLYRHATTVLPHRPSDALVTSGPYRFRRNPIYVADVLILLGLAEVSQNIWLVILAPAFALLVTWLAILPEERYLEARFGEAYRDYLAKTRRWL